MSDIRINQFSHAASTSKAPKRAVKKKAASLPKDQFMHTTQDANTMDKDAVNKFFKDSQNAKEAIKAQSQYKPIPRIDGNAAGWQASIMSQSGTDCFMKIPLSDENQMLVVPLENWGGGAYAKPAVIDFNKGIIDIPDVKPFGNSQGLRYAKSADGKETYLYNGNETRIDVYDETLKNTGSINLSPLDKDIERISEFTPAKSGHYVFASKKNFGPGVFMALEPGTGKLKWKKDYDDNKFIHGIHEGPDNNIYVVMGGFRDTESSIDVYSPNGELVKKIKGLEDPGNLTFTPDGNALVTDGRFLKKVNLKEDAGIFSKKVKAKELWEVKGDFRRFHISDDGKYVFAADTKSGFSRSHGLMKINMKTGKVEWNREKYGENYIDHKVVGDEICLMTSSDDRKSTNLVHLDMDSNETWSANVPSGEVDEYEIGKKDAVSANGHFMIGGRQDGNFSCMHPKKQGEDEKTIKKQISAEDRVIEKAREKMEDAGEAEENKKVDPELEIHDNFVVIGGVRIEKKKKG